MNCNSIDVCHYVTWFEASMVRWGVLNNPVNENSMFYGYHELFPLHQFINDLVI